MAPMDNKIPFAQEERHNFNLLPHRQSRLEHLMTKLQIEGYWDDINKILDNYCQTLDANDLKWKLALNRMDIRKYTIDQTAEPPEKGQIVVIPKIDDDLVDMVKDNQEKVAIVNELLGIRQWARKVLENKDVDDKTLDGWRQYYQRFLRLIEVENEGPSIYKSPIYLAAVGIRFFGVFLSNEEKEWCIKVICNVLKKRIKENTTNENYPNYLDIEPAIKSMTYILQLPLDSEARKEVKEIIFLSLLFLISNEIEYPFETIRNSLWEIDREFANCCFAGMLEFAKLHKMKMESFYLRGTEKEEYSKKFFKKVSALVNKVIEGNLSVNISNLSFNTHFPRDCKEHCVNGLHITNSIGFQNGSPIG